jgi:hypothetical protein
VPALKRDLERYLHIARDRLRAAANGRAGAAASGLNRHTGAVVGSARQCLKRSVTPSTATIFPPRWLTRLDRQAKLEIDRFNHAISERFGDRTLLTNAAREPSGSIFDKAADGLRSGEREQLRQAWPLMRVAQKIAAHERTTQALKQAEQLQLGLRQSMALKL